MVKRANGRQCNPRRDHDPYWTELITNRQRNHSWNFRSLVELQPPLEEQGLVVHTIGDSRAPRSVLAATREGYRLGVSL